MTSALNAINTARPGCILILLDQSDSMKRPSGVVGKSRAVALAEAVNELIWEQINWCRKGDAIVDRFYFGLIGYGGVEAAPRLVEKDEPPLLTASELADRVMSASESDDAPPLWVTPVADGRTPMNDAFRLAASLLEDWAQSHRQSYPPVVCNISDGEWTDADPSPLIAKVMAIATDAGSTRLFNATIRPDEKTVEYPDSVDQLSDEFSRWLFQHSSPVPEEMKGMLAERRGRRLGASARGLIHNGRVAQISDMLYVGSATVAGNIRG